LFVFPFEEIAFPLNSICLLYQPIHL
jgi:hypothetical protein